jgi:hypothetical protein
MVVVDRSGSDAGYVDGSSRAHFYCRSIGHVVDRIIFFSVDQFKVIAHFASL